MDTTETPVADEIVIRYEGPSVKDQAVGALVGTGLALAAGAVYIGACYLVAGGIALGTRLKEKHDAKKALKEDTTTPDSE